MLGFSWSSLPDTIIIFQFPEIMLNGQNKTGKKIRYILLEIWRTWTFCQTGRYFSKICNLKEGRNS